MINNYTSQTGIFVYSTSVVQMPCWHKTEGRKDVSFGETKYFKQRPLKGKCLWLQGTQKVECQAHVEVKLFTLYPGFAASKDEKEGLSMRRLWYLQEEQITSLKTELAKGQPVSTLTRPIRRSPFRASNTHTHTHSLHMSDITPPTLYTHCPTYIVGYGNTKLYSNTRSYSTFDTHSCIHTTNPP